MRSKTLHIEDILEKISHFIWEFKTGDNICYNLQILDRIYAVKEKESKSLLNKVIAIEIVSIVEAVLVDLLDRIDQGTNDLPTIDVNKIIDMKILIDKDKKPILIQDPLVGSYTFRKRKNYQMKDLLNILEEYEILGAKGSNIYEKLRVFNKLRNRVHIPNYYKNFHVDEKRVFENETVIKQLEDTLVEIVDIMSKIYYRHGLSSSVMEGNYKTWKALF
jgi:hypothetical protein